METDNFPIDDDVLAGDVQDMVDEVQETYEKSIEFDELERLREEFDENE